MTKLFLFLVIISSLVSNTFAQFDSLGLGISINAVYTTSADIFLNPNSSDAEARNRSFLIEDIWNPGIDIRYRFSSEFILGLNVEYIKKTANQPNLTAFIGIITLNNVKTVSHHIHFHFINQLFTCTI